MQEAREAGFEGYVPFWVVRDKDGNVLYSRTGALPAANIKRKLIELDVLREAGD